MLQPGFCTWNNSPKVLSALLCMTLVNVTNLSVRVWLRKASWKLKPLKLLYADHRTSFTTESSFLAAVLAIWLGLHKSASTKVSFRGLQAIGFEYVCLSQWRFSMLQTWGFAYDIERRYSDERTRNRRMLLFIIVLKAIHLLEFLYCL